MSQRKSGKNVTRVAKMSLLQKCNNGCGKNVTWQKCHATYCCIFITVCQKWRSPPVRHRAGPKAGPRACLAFNGGPQCVQGGLLARAVITQQAPRKIGPPYFMPTMAQGPCAGLLAGLIGGNVKSLLRGQIIIGHSVTLLMAGRP